MKTRISAACGGVVLLLVACVPSVNPFYHEDDIEFDPALVGDWVDGPDRWVFERLEDLDSAYGLTVTEAESSSTFLATLFSIGDDRFLDIMPIDVKYAENESEFVKAAMISGHLAMHVRAIEPVLEIAFMDLDWVESFLDDNPRALSHQRRGDRIILTGKTRELQRFLRRHVDDGLFDDGSYSEMEKATE